MQDSNLNVLLSRIFKLGSSEPQGYVRTWGSLRDGKIFSNTASFLSLEHFLLIRASNFFLSRFHCLKKLEILWSKGSTILATVFSSTLPKQLLLYNSYSQIFYQIELWVECCFCISSCTFIWNLFAFKTQILISNQLLADSHTPDTPDGLEKTLYDPKKALQEKWDFKMC